MEDPWPPPSPPFPPPPYPSICPIVLPHPSPSSRFIPFCHTPPCLFCLWAFAPCPLCLPAFEQTPSCLCSPTCPSPPFTPIPPTHSPCPLPSPPQIHSTSLPVLPVPFYLTLSVPFTLLHSFGCTLSLPPLSPCLPSHTRCLLLLQVRFGGQFFGEDHYFWDIVCAFVGGWTVAFPQHTPAFLPPPPFPTLCPVLTSLPPWQVLEGRDRNRPLTPHLTGYYSTFLLTPLPPFLPACACPALALPPHTPHGSGGGGSGGTGRREQVGRGSSKHLPANLYSQQHAFCHAIPGNMPM